jgi:hypothetical protein
VGISKEGTGTDMGRRGNPGRKRGGSKEYFDVLVEMLTSITP